MRAHNYDSDMVLTDFTYNSATWHLQKFSDDSAVMGLIKDVDDRELIQSWIQIILMLFTGRHRAFERLSLKSRSRKAVSRNIWAPHSPDVWHFSVKLYFSASAFSFSLEYHVLWNII